ncbi:MAG: phospholipase D family protein [Taibaiella sp.]|nr:phospholipase D family protein [Taibaiella sp.]
MGLFITNVSGAVYSGYNAGRQLYRELMAAKKEVKVISPFITAGYAKRLLTLHEKGICVQLLTNGTSKDFVTGIRNVELAGVLVRQLKSKDGYSYERPFPYKMCDPKYHFIHSKWYIIDEAIAFIGSMNMTCSGFSNNYETRLRITEAATIVLLRKEFDALFNDQKIQEKSLEEWGKEIYQRADCVG